MARLEEKLQFQNILEYFSGSTMRIQGLYIFKNNISTSMHNHLIQLINGALRTQDNVIRANAEQALVNQRQHNTQIFFQTCTDLLCSEKQDQFIRQSAATILSRSISAEPSNQKTFFWDLLNPNLKNNIRNQTLGTLINKNPSVMRSGANVISAIAYVQVPRGQWFDMIEILAENTSHQDTTIRIASMTAIGFICEQFKFGNVMVNEKVSEQFLGAIIIGIRETGNLNIIQTSLKALRDSLMFLKPILHQNDNARHEIFKLLMQKMANYEDTRLIYEVLFEYAKTCYEFLNENMQDIKNFTTAHCSRRDDTAILALQLWDTIGTEFIERNQSVAGRINNFNSGVRNYLIDAQKDILPQVMGCLVIESQRDLDLPELRQSSLKTLGAFAASGDINVVNKIIEGVGQVIQSPNAWHRQATVLLFSALCQFKDLPHIQSLLERGFDSMFNLVTDNDILVARNSLTGFVTISECFPSSFYLHNNVRNIIYTLLELMNSKDARIIEFSLNLLRYITEGLVQNKGQQSPISNDPRILLQPMVSYFQIQLQNFQKEKQKDNREKAVIIIMNCLMKNKDRQVATDLITFLMEKYHEVSKTGVCEKSDKQMMIESILAIMHTAILALEGSLVNHQLREQIYHLIKYHTNIYGVEAEGLNIISSIAIVYSTSLRDYVDQFWNFVLVGIQNINISKTFKAALHCAGDFGRTYKEQLFDKEANLLGRIIRMIHEPIQRQLKIDILITMADLVLGMGFGVEPFLNDILNIIDLSCGAVFEMSENPNDREYMDDLKKAIVELYACLIFALASQKFNKRLFEHFTTMATFVVKTCDTQTNPTIEYLKSCLYLLYDSGSFFSTEIECRDTVKNVLKSDQVKDMRTAIVNFRERDDIRELQQFLCNAQSNLV